MTLPSNKVEHLPEGRLLAEISLWSADLVHIADEMKRVDDLTDVYHVDVADGHFSPAFLFFPDLVAACRKLTQKPIHTHLMMKDEILLEQVKQFAEAGTDFLSVHAENKNVEEAIALIKQLGMQAGVVLQLHTPVAAVKPYLHELSFLTLLGTRIGIKGQSLDPSQLPRLQESKALIAATPRQGRIILAADGGIRENTVPELYRNGAETVVMGSLAFNAPDFPARMAWIRSHKV